MDRAGGAQLDTRELAEEGWIDHIKARRTYASAQSLRTLPSPHELLPPHPFYPKVIGVLQPLPWHQRVWMQPRGVRHRREFRPAVGGLCAHIKTESRAAQNSQGFFPSTTHEKLPSPFETWESHLAAANGRLILGAVEDGDFGETAATRQWRGVIDNVRKFQISWISD